MISRSLAARTADFLKNYPPFSFMDMGDLEALAAEISLRYYAEGELVFEAESPAQEQFFVLHKGRVELFQPEKQSYRLIDVCDEGESFGLRAMLSRRPYLTRARVAEDALVYLVPGNAFLPLMERYPRVGLFFAAGFAAGMTVVRSEEKEYSPGRRELLFRLQESRAIRESSRLFILPRTDLLHCLPGTSIAEAARRMSARRVSSMVVVNEQMQPLGILTDSDMTRKVASGQVGTDAPVQEAMSSPVATARAELTLSQAMLLLMRHHVRYLVITEDGSSQSRCTGIVSEHDLLMAQGNNPAMRVRQIMKTQSPAELVAAAGGTASLLMSYAKEEEVPVSFLAPVLTGIYDAVAARATELAQQSLHDEGLTLPAASFCRLHFDAMGRGEQFLYGKRDDALLCENSETDLLAAARHYFARLDLLTAQTLIACGWRQWKDTEVRQTVLFLPDAKVQISTWLKGGELPPQGVWDFRAVQGDQRLAEQLRAFLMEELPAHPDFFKRLAVQALENEPPLSFLKNFVVERSGRHKDQFDIQLRGIAPLTDAVRVLALHAGICETSTFLRLEQLAAHDPAQQQLYEEAADTLTLLLRHRLKYALEGGGSGRYLNPDHLNRIERQTLKYAFRTIGELQELIKNRFT